MISVLAIADAINAVAVTEITPRNIKAKITQRKLVYSALCSINLPALFCTLLFNLGECWHILRRDDSMLK